MSSFVLKEFTTLIQALPVEELEILERQINGGHISQAIAQRKQVLTNPALVCPVCEKNVSEQKDLVLEFGPEGLRQKARFCGHDCLSYFFMNESKNT